MTRHAPFATALVATTLLMSAPLFAQNPNASVHDHAHDHDHSDTEKSVYEGYFDDDQVQPRPLADYAGDWQSVYPLLRDGALAPVMQHKAQTGDRTQSEHQSYYEVGYATDVDRITIDGESVSFHKGQTEISARYAADGHEILTYSKGNRGVRFIFAKVSGDAAAPGNLQFSDHGISPGKAHHFHLYSGDDRTALLSELTNWPTYFPAELDAGQIVEQMISH